MANSRGFYTETNVLRHFSDVPVMENYTPVPNDWTIVVTDVVGSTKAIEAGKYKDVNALGVASIVVVVNALTESDIPFVFGGDGATLVVPTAHIEEVCRALRGLKILARDSFDLEMRAGLVPVAALEKDGFEQRVARYRVSEYISLAMFAGSGFAESERRVKCEVDGPQYAVQDQGDLDASFDGFECRWNPIRSTNGVVVSLIVQARGEAESEREAVYGRVLDKLNDLLAGKDGSPVDESTLTLATDPIHFDAEARLKSGSRSGFGYSATRFGISVVATIGRYLLRSRRDALGFPGSVYRNQVVANTDFRKFDGTLRMVLDLTHDQHDKLMDMLRVAHESQDIFFGAHTTEASLMTCVIAAHDGDHIHFVDGSDGGYAMAAKGLKKQIVDAKRN